MKTGQTERLTLHEAVNYIDAHYQQELIEQDDFDYIALTNIRKKYPKYLFRGEEDIRWPSTSTSFSRNKEIIMPFFDEFKYCITGRNPIVKKYHPYALYFFIREALYNISCCETSDESFRYDGQIAAIMQHYGIPSSFLDVTSDLRVAAHFAVGSAVVDQIGQVMVLPTKNLEYSVNDLSIHPNSRPDRQKGYALLLDQFFDLKNKSFKNKHEVAWNPFRLTLEDIREFENPSLMYAFDDVVAEYLIQWYETYIKTNDRVSKELRTFLVAKLL